MSARAPDIRSENDSCYIDTSSYLLQLSSGFIVDDTFDNAGGLRGIQGAKKEKTVTATLMSRFFRQRKGRPGELLESFQNVQAALTVDVVSAAVAQVVRSTE